MSVGSGVGPGASLSAVGGASESQPSAAMTMGAGELGGASTGLLSGWHPGIMNMPAGNMGAGGPVSAIPNLARPGGEWNMLA